MIARSLGPAHEELPASRPEGTSVRLVIVTRDDRFRRCAADRARPELQLTLDGRAIPHHDVVTQGGPEPSSATAEGELVDAVLAELEVGEETDARELDLTPRARGRARGEYLYVAGERMAARAASPATRRQYASIYRTFGDWLRVELDRPPTTSDLTGDAFGAFGRHLEVTGGRGGGPASTATRRVYLNMVRALARDLGLDQEAGRVRVPRHRAGPPETLTKTDYANLLRVPDRRSVIGKRDVALLRVLGDCGLRSALSAQAGYKIVNRAAAAAGVPERLCHPHALRSYWATSLLEDGVPVHVVQAGLGHADLSTTGRYAVVWPEHRDELVDVLDRRHQDARRRRG